MSNQQPTPSKMQLRLKEACIKVEKRFMLRDSRMAFAIKFTPAALVFAVAVLCDSLPALPAVIAAVVAGYAAIESAVRRLRDCGCNSVQMLQIVVPIFVCGWIGPRITSHSIRIAFYSLLCLWPAILILKLYFKGSVPNTDYQ